MTDINVARLAILRVAISLVCKHLNQVTDKLSAAARTKSALVKSEPTNRTAALELGTLQGQYGAFLFVMLVLRALPNKISGLRTDISDEELQISVLQLFNDAKQQLGSSIEF